ncbi:MAG: hypothetical protein H0U23_00365 [Blastocatellia bacterium]|nr:hypothetical protein [Blastocatellia bacterium]
MHRGTVDEPRPSRAVASCASQTRLEYIGTTTTVFVYDVAENLVVEYRTGGASENDAQIAYLSKRETVVKTVVAEPHLNRSSH